MEGGRIDLRSERPKRSFWQKVVDLALTDARTLQNGIDEASIERLERTLLESDFGVPATMELIAELERAAERGKVRVEEDLRALLSGRVREMLVEGDSEPAELERPPEGPGVTLVLGVNGTGKTTTAGKLAWRFIQRGEKVLLAATDTFRAGAQKQLRIWAERVGAGYVGGREGGDPAAVAYDALEAALSRGYDRLLVDTAGRLHTQRNLMEELGKIDRVLGRLQPGAPHERILVVDATSGQNVLSQAADFGAAVALTGLIVAKFDSSARAGTIVSVARELSLPVRYLGTGERPEDLELFGADRYLAKIFG
ncbi:MAG: signal recognition particle-docking protein FtsY [Gemmatimonadota bacterium]